MVSSEPSKAPPGKGRSIELFSCWKRAKSPNVCRDLECPSPSSPEIMFVCGPRRRKPICSAPPFSNLRDSLACCMDAASILGPPGHSMRELSARLGVQRIRFRPLLPLGRASSMSEPVMCEGLHAHMTPDEMLKADFQPLYTCGIGQNLYVEPDGNSFPCYA